MIEVLSKLADQIGIDDIKGLIASEVPKANKSSLRKACCQRGKRQIHGQPGMSQATVNRLYSCGFNSKVASKPRGFPHDIPCIER